jgi:glycerophosphoryl diester phosphodiesterase
MYCTLTPMIIGHRGAGKSVGQNTIASLKKAVELRLHAVEFDIQLTKDHKFVLSHDGVLNTSDEQIVIAQQTKNMLMKKGLPSLEQALDALHEVTAIIDIKVWDSSQYLLPAIEKRHQSIRLTGSNVPDIAYCKKYAPKRFAYISENKNPFRAIKRAKQINADGISLKWFLINPITYTQAKRLGLEIMLYTINSQLIGWIVGTLYPEVSICTDQPKRFIDKRYNW